MFIVLIFPLKELDSLGYADDLVLTAQSEHDVLERFVRWRKELELRGENQNDGHRKE